MGKGHFLLKEAENICQFKIVFVFLLRKINLCLIKMLPPIV